MLSTQISNLLNAGNLQMPKGIANKRNSQGYTVAITELERELGVLIHSSTFQH